MFEEVVENAKLVLRESLNDVSPAMALIILGSVVIAVKDLMPEYNQKAKEATQKSAEEILTLINEILENVHA